jgi:CRP-like cAMP-binding protein
MPTGLLRITKDNFAEKMKGNSEFAFHLLKSLTKRLDDTTNELMMLKFVISG